MTLQCKHYLLNLSKNSEELLILGKREVRIHNIQKSEQNRCSTTEKNEGKLPWLKICLHH